MVEQGRRRRACWVRRNNFSNCLFQAERDQTRSQVTSPHCHRESCHTAWLLLVKFVCAQKRGESWGPAVTRKMESFYRGLLKKPSASRAVG